MQNQTIIESINVKIDDTDDFFSYSQEPETQNFEDQIEENKNLQEFCVVNSGSDYLIELLLANSANLALVAKGVDPPEEDDEF